MHLKFHPIEDRKFLTLDMGSTPGFSWPDSWGEEMQGAVVRVKYALTEEEARSFDQAGLRRSLLACGAAKVVLRPTVEREVRARVAEMAEDMSEAAALDLWLESQGINGTEASALREAHAEYVGRLSA